MARARLKNPFQFGRELAAAELVDRTDELRQVTRAMENAATLFVIGPRRHGKTSLLHAAEAQVERTGTVVLRYDAERYESLDLLAQAILTGASRRLAGTVERARDLLEHLAGRLKPEISYSVEQGEFSIILGALRGDAQELPLLTDVLDAVEQMAVKAGKAVTVVIDEFQHIVEMHGEAAERQVRATVQRHHNVAYIFAGSKTRLLADMTGNPNRAFYKLGARLFVGPVPRDEFLAFLHHGFAQGGFSAEPASLDRILETAEEVPYSVQRLAHECWEMLRVSPDPVLTVPRVDAACVQVLRQENPAYTQVWNDLTRQQKRVVKAIILEGGRSLMSADVSRRHQVPTGTMQRALKALERKQIIRAEEQIGAVRYRLEDPLFGAWVRWVQEL